MIGAVGMSLSDFDQLDWLQVESISTAYQKRQEDQLQTSWEQTRQVMLVTLKPHLKKGAKLKPVDVLRFPWDMAEGADLLSPEDAKKAAQELNEHWARLEQKKNLKNSPNE